MHPAVWGIVVAALTFGGSESLRGASDPLPVGSQFQVNSYTPSDQYGPAIAAAADGDFVVVWESFGSSGGDTSGYSIQGQRFAASAAPDGIQFQVNSYTTRGQIIPSVAADRDGDFVVVWESFGSGLDDTSGYSVQSRRFAANGTPSGSQFQANAYTTNYQRFAAVAADPDGDFLVVWSSDGATVGDTIGYSIQGQRYAANGTTQGFQFQVNGYGPNDQVSPAAAADGAGNFVVVWASDGSYGGDTSDLSILGQRFLAGGGPWGSEFQVNTYTLNRQFSPAVAAAPGGESVVVWASNGSTGGDTSGYSIRGRRYAANGAPVGSEFQVNAYTTSQQLSPAIAADGDGDVVVIWESSGSSGDDSSGFSIQGQRYAANGALSGSQFQVNSYTTNDQRYPTIAAGSDGDFVVVWQSNGSSGGDTSLSSVQGQRFRVTGDLRGTVFLDQDEDGIRGGMEPGVAGVTVQLYDAGPVLRRTTVTDGNGDYALKPKEGSWTVKFLPPNPNFSFTAQDVGGDDTVDSDADPLTGVTDPVPIAINALNDTTDAGLLFGIFADGYESGDLSAWDLTQP